MVIRGSARRKGTEIFKKVIDLRKRGFSYTEIKNETGVAKSTINNWLSFAGLTLTAEHLQIQESKRVENHILGTEASKITRARRKDEDIQRFIQEKKVYFEDPFFVAGVMLYEAEGTKVSNNNFSNSDFRLVITYVRFLEKYFKLDRKRDMNFRLYVHITRKDDLNRIINFWSKKLNIDMSDFSISWKKNIVAKRQKNLDYVGQMGVSVHGIKNLVGKIVTISDIMLSVFQR